MLKTRPKKNKKYRKIWLKVFLTPKWPGWSWEHFMTSFRYFVGKTIWNTGSPPHNPSLWHPLSNGNLIEQKIPEDVRLASQLGLTWSNSPAKAESARYSFISSCWEMASESGTCKSNFTWQSSAWPEKSNSALLVERVNTHARKTSFSPCSCTKGGGQAGKSHCDCETAFAPLASTS